MSHLDTSKKKPTEKYTATARRRPPPPPTIVHAHDQSNNQEACAATNRLCTSPHGFPWNAGSGLARWTYYGIRIGSHNSHTASSTQPQTATKSPGEEDHAKSYSYLTPSVSSENGMSRPIELSLRALQINLGLECSAVSGMTRRSSDGPVFWRPPRFESDNLAQPIYRFSSQRSHETPLERD